MPAATAAPSSGGTSVLPSQRVSRTRFGAPVGAVDPASEPCHPAAHLWLLAWVFVASWGAVLITPPTSSLSIWWPASLVGVGVLLQAPRARWPALTVLLTLVVSLGQLLAGRDLGLGIGLGATTALTSAVMALLLSRPGASTLRDLHDVVRLLVAVLAGALVLAAGLAALMTLLPGADYLDLVGQVTMSHLTAALCLGPLFLTAPTEGRVASREQVVQWTLLVALELWVFVTPAGEGMAYALLPVLLWGAIRQSTRLAAIQSLTVTIVAVLLFSLGRGPFTVGPGQPYVDWTAATTALQLFLSSLAITAVVVSVAGQQQRRAAQAAREESEFTRTVLATTDALTLVVDGRGRIELANGAAERALGHGASELVGAVLWDSLLPEARRAEVRSAFLTADGPEALALRPEQEWLTRCGRPLRVRVSTSALLRGPDRPDSVVLTAIDVTREHRTGDFLRRMLRASSGTAAIGVRLDGTMTVFSRGAEELLGYRADEAIGRGFTTLVARGSCDGLLEVGTGADPGHELRRLHQQFTPGSAARDWWWRRADGELVAVSQTLDEVRDGSGRVTDYLVIARDVTEDRHVQEALVAALRREREAVERLRALDQAKNDFVTTVSHELRTPISSIVGYAELLRDAVGHTEHAPLVEAMARNGHRLRNLADDLVTLSDLESYRAHDTGPVDLRVLVREVVAAHATAAASRGQQVSLRDDLPGDAPCVVAGDAGHLRRAVANVVDNACKFSPDGGAVSVELSGSGATARVRVRDRGMGIPADEVDQVFERFYRARNAHDRAIQGPGLGLSLTEAVLRLLGGSVTLTPAPGGGTEAELVIPRAGDLRTG